MATQELASEPLSALMKYPGEAAAVFVDGRQATARYASRAPVYPRAEATAALKFR